MIKRLLAACAVAAAALVSSAAESAVDEMSNVFTFSLVDVTARVTPSATTAWTASGATFGGSFREAAVLRDSDHDGAVRWNIGHLLPANGIISVVDMSARAVHAARMDGTALEVAPLEATFLRGSTGRYDHVEFHFGWSYLLMWVRPGVGAWTKSAANGSFGDLDDELDDRLLVYLGDAQPVGNSPSAPAGFEPGDLLLGNPGIGGGTFFGGLVDDALATSAITPAVIRSHNVVLNEDEQRAQLWVVRTGSTDAAATLNYHTTDDTAVSGIHYTATAGTVTFERGQLIATIDVPVIDDDVYSGRVAFRISLTDLQGAAFEDESSFLVTIKERDPKPVVTFGDVTLPEGASGDHAVRVPVTLSGRTRIATTVNWRWSEDTGSSPAPSDQGQLVFAPGETEKFVTVPYTADSTSDGNRVFYVNGISDDATVNPGTVRVIEDDTFALTAHNFTAREREGEAWVEIRLSDAHIEPVAVSYRTVLGDTEDEDIVAESGRVTFAPGETRKYVQIAIISDSDLEYTESFFVELFDATPNAWIHTHRGTVTIYDDDPDTSAVVTADLAVVVREGTDALATAHFTVDPKKMQRSVELRFLTVQGDAGFGRDYQDRDETISLGGSLLSHSVQVPIVNDDIAEPAESFGLLVFAPGVRDPVAFTSMIVFDDDTTEPPPALVMVSNAPAVREDAQVARFVVQLRQPAVSPASVQFETSPNTAVEGGDYLPLTGNITFAAGEQSKIIEIPLVDDAVREANEEFILRLRPPGKDALLLNDRATCVITDDDAPTIGRSRSVRH